VMVRYSLGARPARPPQGARGPSTAGWPPALSVRARSAVAFLLIFTLLTSCGRKAPVHPPEDVLPQRITDLSAASSGDGIQLSWSRPQLYVDGSRMTDLGGFVVERSAPQAAFERLAVLEVNDQQRFRQIKHFKHVDRDTMVGTAYSYRVVSFTLDRYFSEPSNIATAERQGTNEEKHAPLPPMQR